MARRKQANNSTRPKKPSVSRSNGDRQQLLEWFTAVLGIKGWLLLAIAALMFSLTIRHTPGVNGPYYWTWPWRELSTSQWLVMLLCALPAVAMIWLFRNSRLSNTAMLLGWMLAALSLKLGCVWSQATPIGWSYLRDVTLSPDATSYYYDAARIVHTIRTDDAPRLLWLQHYDELVRTPPPHGFHLHTMTKPAGPLGFYVALVLLLGFGPTSMLICSLTLIGLSLLSIPAVYWCIERMTERPECGLMAASLLALTPGYLLFPTKFDPLWVGLGAITVGIWHQALVRNSHFYSLLLAIPLGLILFVGFQQLTLGLFMALLPAIVLSDRPWMDRYVSAVRLGAPPIIVIIVVDWIVNTFLGYSSWRVFQANLFAQSKLMEQPMLAARRAPWTAGWDVYDFALGSGWILAIVFVMGLVNSQLERRVRQFGWAAGALLAVIAVLALIPAETARCWLFLAVAPLVIVAAEVNSWPRDRQVVAMGGVLLATLIIHGNMAFILP
ncbi:MAG: hypothetical protein KF752_19325 [Pirellulaceae bacterium]|nr:hypothetical protein [Pirellulaceae bacterium]